MQEANTFWFYALAFSIAGAMYALLFSSPAKPLPENTATKEKATPKPDQGKTKAASPAGTAETGNFKLVRQIVAESCDLLLPATLLGWMRTGDLIVGLTMVLSTLLTSMEIWKGV